MPSLSSALSVLVTFPGAAADGTDVQVKIDRDPNQVGAYGATYPVGQPIRAVVTGLNATFYAQAGETGPVVGTAQALIQPSGQSLQLTTIVLNGTIKSVAVIPPPPLTRGTTTQLTAQAKDGSGNTVAVSAGSFQWSVSSGGANLTLTADGNATAVQDGTANVAVSVDGATSAAATITITD